MMLCLTMNVSGQRVFQTGTIITLNGDSTSAQISASNWVTNPEFIRYKTSEDGEMTTVRPGDIRGFIIPTKGTFVSATLEIDQSSDKIDRLSGSDQPKWESMAVFLKQIVRGTINLYSYRSTNVNRLIVQKPGGEYQQLVYKLYLSSSRNLLYNRAFRKQLWENFNCGITKDQLREVEYSAKSLTKFFLKYAECTGGKALELKTSREKGSFKFYGAAGAGSINGDYKEFSIDQTAFESSVSFRVDLGVEYRFPSQNPIALFLNIGSESFSTTGVWPDQVFLNERRTAQVIADQPWTVDVSYGTVGFGVRKYYYFNRDSGLKLSLLCIPQFTLWSNSQVEKLDIPDARNTPGILTMEENTHFGLGAGYVFKRFTADLTYFIRRQHLRDIQDISVGYSSLYLSLGILLN